jgi:hypothetical protein
MGNFMAAALFAHMAMGKYLYSAWPFDGLCWNDKFNGIPEENITQTVNAECNPIERALSVEWGFASNSPKTILTSFYQWVLILVVGFGIIYSVFFKYKGFFRSLFHAELKDTSNASDECFSQQPSIKLYLPEFQYTAQVHPLLACDMSKIENRYISWVGDFEENNLYEYARKQEFGEPLDLTKTFSTCKQYVKYDDRFVYFATKIQRAQRGKNAYRKMILDRKALEDEKEKGVGEEAQFRQQYCELKRIEMAIRAVDEKARDADLKKTEVHEVRLQEMSQELEKLRALDDFPQKLQQLDVLEGLDGKLEDMHANLKQLEKLDDLHGQMKGLGEPGGAFEQLGQLSKIGPLEDRLEDVNARLGQLHSTQSDALGEFHDKIGTTFAASSEELENRLTAFSAVQLKAIKAEIAASREEARAEQNQLLEAVARLHKEHAVQRAVEIPAAERHESLNVDVSSQSRTSDPCGSTSISDVPKQHPSSPRMPVPETPTPPEPSRRRSRLGKTRKPDAASAPAYSPRRHYCTFWEGPFEGEQQKIEISAKGFNMHSKRGETQVKWHDIQKWRVDEENRFEFDTAYTRFPCIFASTEQALAMLELFQDRCTMQLECFQLMDEDDDGADDEGEVMVLVKKTEGVSINGKADIPWADIQQWNLEAGETEADGSIGMDMFEFWAKDCLGGEKEYALECDGIDAVYLQASFEQHAKPSGMTMSQCHRVIV